MWKLYVSVAFIIMSFLVSSGNANLECPNPPVSAQLYFDVEEIVLTAVKDKTGSIETTQWCHVENDPICKRQQCCAGEVGCCYMNPIRNVTKCGCKSPTDKICTHPAPIAIIKGAACEAHKHAKIAACFRKSRGGVVGEYTLTGISSIDVHNSTRTDTTDLKHETPVGEIQLGSYYAANDDNSSEGVKTIRRFSADQLVQKLNKRILDEIVEKVVNLNKKGLPYGKD